MTLTLAQLDAMPETEAAFKLAACCGSSKWVAAMVARRPYRTRDELLAVSDDVARTLGPEDWLEAFAYHPRIGERKSSATASSVASAWSDGEQAASSSASIATREALALANVEYEQRFGYIFIICAHGRSADEILGELRKRMKNEPDAELAIAAAEQQEITRQRLEKLIPADNGTRS